MLAQRILDGETEIDMSKFALGGYLLKSERVKEREEAERNGPS